MFLLFLSFVDIMMPIRCYTCCKVIGHLHEMYAALRAQGISQNDVFVILKVHRTCCKTRLMTAVQLIQTEMIPTDTGVDEVQTLSHCQEIMQISE